MHHQVHGARPGLAQRTGRQQEAVARALVVEDADFNVACQRQMLQAVVADDHVGIHVRCQERTGRSHALLGHKHRHAAGAGDQRRLVAHLAGRAVGQHRTAIAGAAPVAARNHTGVQPQGLQVLYHGHHHGGFARAARNHIADHDDRHARVGGAQHAAAVQRTAQQYQQGHDEGEWPEQPCQQTPTLPDALQQGCRCSEGQ